MANLVLFPTIHLAERYVIAIRLENRIIAMPLFTPHRPNNLPSHHARKNLVMPIGPCEYQVLLQNRAVLAETVH